MWKTYFCELVLSFSLSLEKKHCSAILWTLLVNNYQKHVEIYPLGSYNGVL